MIFLSFLSWIKTYREAFPHYIWSLPLRLPHLHLHEKFVIRVC